MSKWVEIEIPKEIRESYLKPAKDVGNYEITKDGDKLIIKKSSEQAEKKPVKIYGVK